MRWQLGQAVSVPAISRTRSCFCVRAESCEPRGPRSVSTILCFLTYLIHFLNSKCGVRGDVPPLRANFVWQVFGHFDGLEPRFVADVLRRQWSSRRLANPGRSICELVIAIPPQLLKSSSILCRNGQRGTGPRGRWRPLGGGSRTVGVFSKRN